MYPCFRISLPLRLVTSARLPQGSHRYVLTVSADDLPDLFPKPSSTALAYKDVPLASLVPKMRGEVISDIVRGVLSEKNPNHLFSDALPGFCINGNRRSAHQSEFDFHWNEKRVECKSSQITWQKGLSAWRASFAGIKWCSFDVLVLALYTPRGLFVFRTDATSWLPAKRHLGKLDACRYSIAGNRHECLGSSVDTILSKMRKSNKESQASIYIPFDHRLVHAAVGGRAHKVSNIYLDAPLACLPPSDRGLSLQSVVRTVDQMLNPFSKFEAPMYGTCANGRSRGEHKAEYDWLRDGKRIECKHGSLLWDRFMCRWYVRFLHVKFALDDIRSDHAFDELLLAFYTPRGVYIYRHDHVLGVSTQGVQTESRGHRIEVSAAQNVLNWQIAVDLILEKLDKSDCSRLAFIAWSR